MKWLFLASKKKGNNGKTITPKDLEHALSLPPMGLTISSGNASSQAKKELCGRQALIGLSWISHKNTLFDPLGVFSPQPFLILIYIHQVLSAFPY